MKTSELTGAALDWAVAKCEGIEVIAMKDELAIFLDPADDGSLNEMPINYSTDWAQGGAIIERECISLFNCYGDSEWSANTEGYEYHATTPLEAAMRCYVASKLGDEVKVPEELLSCAHA